MTIRRLIRCPTCATPVSWEGNDERPFCSQRCRMLDLGKWATESYRIAGDAAGEVDDGSNGDDTGGGGHLH